MNFQWLPFQLHYFFFALPLRSSLFVVLSWLRCFSPSLHQSFFGTAPSLLYIFAARLSLPISFPPFCSHLIIMDFLSLSFCYPFLAVSLLPFSCQWALLRLLFGLHFSVPVCHKSIFVGIWMSPSFLPQSLIKMRLCFTCLLSYSFLCLWSGFPRCLINELC